MSTNENTCTRRPWCHRHTPPHLSIAMYGNWSVVSELPLHTFRARHPDPREGTSPPGTRLTERSECQTATRLLTSCTRFWVDEVTRSERTRDTADPVAQLVHLLGYGMEKFEKRADLPIFQKAEEFWRLFLVSGNLPSTQCHRGIRWPVEHRRDRDSCWRLLTTPRLGMGGTHGDGLPLTGSLRG